jgi:hypothetical protein
MMRAASRRAEAEAEDPFHIAKGRPDAFDDVPETPGQRIQAGVPFSLRACKISGL